MKFQKLILVAVIMFGAVSVARAQQSSAFNAAEQFVKAGMAYKSGEYKDAIAGYEAIIQNSLESGLVYYNLGNSYFKDEQLGRAVLNYERARQLMPRDGDLKSNYRYARSQILNNTATPQENFLERLFSSYIGYWTIDEITWILFVLAALAGGVCLVGLYWRWPPARTRMTVALLIVAFAFNAFAFSVESRQMKTAAVILTQSDAKFEPLENATTYFKLSEGEKVRVLRTEGDWAKIRRADGKVGWVLKTAFTRL